MICALGVREWRDTMLWRRAYEEGVAYSYYNDPTLWWIISAANNNITKGALYPEPGTQLRIPTDLNYVLDLYNQFNQAR